MPKVVGIKLTDADYATWASWAKKAGRSIPGWVRECVEYAIHDFETRRSIKRGEYATRTSEGDIVKAEPPKRPQAPKESKGGVSDKWTTGNREDDSGTIDSTKPNWPDRCPPGVDLTAFISKRFPKHPENCTCETCRFLRKHGVSYQ